MTCRICHGTRRIRVPVFPPASRFEFGDLTTQTDMVYETREDWCWCVRDCLRPPAWCALRIDVRRVPGEECIPPIPWTYDAKGNARAPFRSTWLCLSRAGHEWRWSVCTMDGIMVADGFGRTRDEAAAFLERDWLRMARATRARGRPVWVPRFSLGK